MAKHLLTLLTIPKRPRQSRDSASHVEDGRAANSEPHAEDGPGRETNESTTPLQATADPRPRIRAPRQRGVAPAGRRVQSHRGRTSQRRRFSLHMPPQKGEGCRKSGEKVTNLKRGRVDPVDKRFYLGRPRSKSRSTRGVLKFVTFSPDLRLQPSTHDPWAIGKPSPSLARTP